MAVEAFITVHDQVLVVEAERAGQFAGLSHTWLFVGHRPVERVPSDAKVVVARDHDPNIEHWPSLYDFTGWWTLAHHRLIDADDVIFLQYDMHVVDPALADRCETLLAEKPGVVAFTAGHHQAGNFLLSCDGFDATYRAGLASLGVAMDGWPSFNEWPSTQGTAWDVVDFYDFMDWVTPALAVFAGSTWAGHLAERLVKAWCVARGCPESYLPGVISHAAADCHGTGALMRGDHGLYQARQASFVNQSS